MADKTGTRAHIGCSEAAWSVILQDYERFNPGRHPLSRDAFLNELLQSSISDSYLREVLVRAGSNTEGKQEDRLFSRLQKNDRKCRASFNLYETTATILGIDDPDGPIQKSFRTPGLWINEVLETYAELPYLFRERIILRKTVSLLQAAIRAKALVQAQTASPGTDGAQIYHSQHFLPYAIRADSMGMYLYVCGMDLKKQAAVLVKEKNENVFEKCPISFRVARLRNVQIQPAPCKLTQADMDRLEDKMLAAGIQYITTDVIDASVLLTKDGWNMYRRKLWNRPPVEKVGSYNETYTEYRCHASAFQIRNYFNSSFGAEAVVIAPADLKEQIRQNAEELEQAYTEYPETSNPV